MSANGLRLFAEEVKIDFYAEKRVVADNAEMVNNAFGNIYTNNVLSIVGINAYGKTSLLIIEGLTPLRNCYKSIKEKSC